MRFRQKEAERHVSSSFFATRVIVFLCSRAARFLVFVCSRATPVVVYLCGRATRVMVSFCHCLGFSHALSVSARRLRHGVESWCSWERFTPFSREKERETLASLDPVHPYERKEARGTRAFGFLKFRMSAKVIKMRACRAPLRTQNGWIGSREARVSLSLSLSRHPVARGILEEVQPSGRRGGRGSPEARRASCN